MPTDELDDDEDWYDDPNADDDTENHETPPCPECGKPVPDIAARCPACGYWMTDEDRLAMWSGEARPAWVKLTAVILLVTLLYGMFSLSMGWF